MKSFLSLSVILLYSLLNASFALSRPKTLPSTTRTKCCVNPNTTITSTVTKTKSTLSISYYTVSYKYGKEGRSTILPNNVVVKPNSYSCTKLIGEEVDKYIFLTRPSYIETCDFKEKTTLSYTIPLTTKRCEVKTTTCREKKETTIVPTDYSYVTKTIPTFVPKYIQANTVSKYSQTNSGSTKSTFTGKYINNTIYTTIIDNKRTTIIGDIYKTIIKPYTVCKDIKTISKCVYSSIKPKTITTKTPPCCVTRPHTSKTIPTIPKTTPTTTTSTTTTTTTTTTTSITTTTSYSYKTKTIPTTITRCCTPPHSPIPKSISSITTSYSNIPKITTTTTTTSIITYITTSNSQIPKIVTTTATPKTIPTTIIRCCTPPHSPIPKSISTSTIISITTSNSQTSKTIPTSSFKK